MQVQLASQTEELGQCRKDQDEIKRHYIARIDELQSRMQAVRDIQQRELNKEKDKLREQQSLLEHKLITMEGDIHCQQDELSARFEQVLKEREREYEGKRGELQSALTTCEATLRETTRELQVCRSSYLSLEKEAKERADDLVRAEKETKSQQWALEDQRCMQDALISDLERTLSQSQSALCCRNKEFQKRLVIL